MKMYKYSGKIYEGRWEVVSRENKQYRLRNIFNNTEIIVSEKTLLRVDRNETTISHVLMLRLIKMRRNHYKW